MAKNKNKKEQILKTLKKIKKLGIERVLFNKNADFTGKEYSMIIDRWNYSPCLRQRVLQQHFRMCCSFVIDFSLAYS